jgi:hypothetical protein
MTVSRREDRSLRRFDNRQAQIVLAAVAGLFVLIGLAGVAESSSRVEGAVYLLFGGFSLVRALRTSCVSVDGLGVSTRSMVRTRRYLFSELRGVEVAVGRTGFAGFGREHLVFHRADGQDVAFKELNCRPPKPPDTTSVVRRAAACINERLPRR